MEKNNKTKTKQKKQSHNIIYKIISFITIVLSVLSISYLIYKSIFPIFYIIPIAFLIIIILFMIAIIMSKNKTHTYIKNILSIFCILIVVVEAFAFNIGEKTTEFISNIHDNGERLTTYGLYVLNDSEYNSIYDLSNKKITYLNSTDDEEIRSSLTEVSNIITFEEDYLDTIDELLNSLKDSETDAIFFDTSYEDIIKEEYDETYTNIKNIYTVEVTKQVETLKSNKDITKDSFTIYLSGIDTSGKKISSKSRSDVNILLSINPTTKQMLMISTPRDSYVTLHSKNAKDKLTHAGIYGIEESVTTLEDLYDVEVDYYARVNFTSFISIVNTLGGITVTVPKAFCEQDSNRSKKEEDLICLKKGTYTLDGEEALAYARNRHNFSGGDFARGEHQMQIIKAILKKAMSPSIIAKYTSLLDSLSGKVTTNMSQDDITKFINKSLTNFDDWTIENYSVSGVVGSGVCFSTGRSKLSIVNLDETSVADAKQELKNLYNGESNLKIGTSTYTETTTTN